MSTIITHLLLKNVRCFPGEQRAELAKVTLLVGENSVGKSTFLGCLKGVAHLSSLVELADGANCFDQEPFCMGSFKHLVRLGCSAFQVGVGLDGDCFRRFDVEFAAGPGGGLRETTLEVELSDDRPNARAALRITRPRDASEDVDAQWCLDGPGFEFRLDQSDVSYTAVHNLAVALHTLRSAAFRWRDDAVPKEAGRHCVGSRARSVRQGR